MSLVIYKEDVLRRSHSLFAAAMDYATFLDTSLRPHWVEFIRAVWQPHDLEEIGFSSLVDQEVGLSQYSGVFSRGGSRKRKERDWDSALRPRNDAFEMTARRFLQDLECFILFGNASDIIQPATPRMGSAALRIPLTSSVTPLISAHVYNILARFQNTSTMASHIYNVYERLQSEAYPTVRHVEADLLRIRNLRTPELDDFEYMVRDEFNTVYCQLSLSSDSRVLYDDQMVEWLRILVLAEDLSQSQQVHELSSASTPIAPQLAESTTRPRASKSWDSIESTLANTSSHNVTPTSSINLQSPVSPTHQSVFTPGQHVAISPLSTPDASSPSTSLASELAPVVSKFLATPSHEALEQTIKQNNERSVKTPIQSTQQSTTTEPKSSLKKPRRKGKTPEEKGARTQVATQGCTLCSFQPTGNPQWMVRTLRRHMNAMHKQGENVYFSCPFPGCTKRFKDRLDNLQQHQRDEGHFVGDEPQQRPKKQKRR